MAIARRVQVIEKIISEENNDFWKEQAGGDKVPSGIEKMRQVQKDFPAQNSLINFNDFRFRKYIEIAKTQLDISKQSYWKQLKTACGSREATTTKFYEAVAKSEGNDTELENYEDNFINLEESILDKGIVQEKVEDDWVALNYKGDSNITRSALLFPSNKEAPVVNGQLSKSEVQYRKTSK